MAFFDGAKNVQIFGGTFREIHGDIFEDVDPSLPEGILDSGSSVGRGSHDRGRKEPGYSESEADFDRVRQAAVAKLKRAASLRKNLNAEAGENWRFAQPSPQADDFQYDQERPSGGRATDRAWDPRSPEFMTQNNQDAKDASPFQGASFNAKDSVFQAGGNMNLRVENGAQNIQYNGVSGLVYSASLVGTNIASVVVATQFTSQPAIQGHSHSHTHNYAVGTRRFQVEYADLLMTSMMNGFIALLVVFSHFFKGKLAHI